MLQAKQKTLNQIGLCKENYEDVTIKKQNTSVITEGLDLNTSGISRKPEDIRDYFTPEKKRKIDNKNVSIASSSQSCMDEFNSNDIFNDGLNDALCEIDF